MKARIIVWSIVLVSLFVLQGAHALGVQQQKTDWVPVWSIYSDTAYVLDPGQWDLGIIGWITYGLNDKFQLGTNFLGDAGQLMNLYGKCVVYPETDNSPQIAAGASAYLPLQTSISSMYDFSVLLSKSIDNNSYWLHGGLKYSYIGANANYLSANYFGAKVGTIINNAENWRSYLEAYYNWFSFANNVQLGGGFEWKSGSLITSIGGLFASTNSRDTVATFLPFINFQWRF